MQVQEIFYGFPKSMCAKFGGRVVLERTFGICTHEWGEKEGFAWGSFLTRHCPVIDFWCRVFFWVCVCVCVPMFFPVVCVACQDINKQLHGVQRESIYVCMWLSVGGRSPSECWNILSKIKVLNVCQTSQGHCMYNWLSSTAILALS